MARKKKSANDFRLELANFVASLLASLGNDGEQRVHDALQKYMRLFRKRLRGKTPLSAEENQLLVTGCALHDNYLLGKHLDKLQKKLSQAEKREAEEATISASMAFISSSEASTNDNSNIADE